MKATLTQTEMVSNFTFAVEMDGKQYHAKVYLNAKGKFIDDEITYEDGASLEYEGTEGDLREKILDYLGENWDNLVKS